MLLGLFRWRQFNEDGSAFGLGHLLWSQVELWLASTPLVTNVNVIDVY